MNRSGEEMRENRKLKDFRNRYWFQSRRGGARISEIKDHPEGREGKEGRRQPDKKEGKPEGKKTEGEGQREPGKEETKVKVTETPIFVPYTRDSTLRKALQATDDAIGEACGNPAVRFVEICGGGHYYNLTWK